MTARVISLICLLPIAALAQTVLTDQQVITVYLNERSQTGGGTGTLSITLQP